MKKLLIILIPLLFSCVKKEGIPLFKASDTALKGVGNSISVEIDSSSVSRLLAEQPDSIRLSIPAKDGTIWVNVSKNNIFGDGFTVMSDSTTEEYETNDVFYSGKVEDEENSLVAINIVSGEITGFISSLKYGELSIGKTNEVSTTSYMVHENTSDTLVFNCLELDPPNLKELHQLKKTEVSIQADVPRCVTKDFELTYEVFQKYGSVTAATNWVLNLFAAEKAIYKNDGVELVLGLVYVWTTPDGYNSNAATALQQFGDKRRNDPAFKGNIAQLIRGRDGGALSGIAYVDILCNREYRFSYAEPMWTYAAYPSYSWSVEVITHEDGHNIACPHTHNCNWELSPGVFGAIDNCYTTEGGCPASLPCAGCGTIMSYCHLNSAVGIQFRNGFGPIPGARLRARVNGGACAICGVTPPPPGDGEPPTVPILTVSNITQTGCVLTWNACLDNVGVVGYDVYQNNSKTFSTTGLTYTVTGLSAGTSYGFHIVSKDAAGNFSTGSETPVKTLPVVVPPPSGGNVALNKTAYQSSEYGGYPASNAFDGNVNTFSHTQNPVNGVYQVNPWISVDLGAEYNITSVIVKGRTSCCQQRIRQFKIFVSNNTVKDYNALGTEKILGSSGLNTETLNISGKGRFITFMSKNFQAGDFLSLGEMEVYGTPTGVNPCVPRDTVYRVLRDSVGTVCR